MEGKFDEALVETLGRKIFDLSFGKIGNARHGSSDDFWRNSSARFKASYSADAREVLADIASTHAVVTKEEYEATQTRLGEADRLLVSVHTVLQGRSPADPSWWPGLVNYMKSRLAKEASRHA